MWRKGTTRTSSSGVMSARNCHSGLPARLASRSQTRVDKRRGREVDDALLGPDPAELAVVGRARPERAEVAGDVLERPARDEMRERCDRRDAELVAAAGREGQPVALDAVAGVGPEHDIGRGVVGLPVDRVRPVERDGRGKPDVLDEDVR